MSAQAVCLKKKTTRASIAATHEFGRSEYAPVIGYAGAIDSIDRTLCISAPVEVLGFAPDQWLADSKLWTRQLHPNERRRVLAIVTRSQLTGLPFNTTYRMIARDGSTTWLRDEGEIVSGKSGQPRFLQGRMFDITERKRRDVALRSYSKRLQELSRRLLEVQETERRTLARELHDEIGQALTMMKINLQTMQGLANLSQSIPYLKDSVDIVGYIIEEVRNLSLDLHPSMLDDLGLLPALRWYLDRQAQRTNLAIKFMAQRLRVRPSAGIETVCFRIVQEALTNVIRHAQAKEVRVKLQPRGSVLHVVIRDDGVGFDVRLARKRAERGDSLGLLGMEERALLAGGQIEIKSMPTLGTEIHVKLPLRDRVDAS
ncbi:MAG: PAS domain-containing protein [Acidobacteria bacterium]|nr:PAS domain-containing protein [Acidobacteriota bacterium]MCI0719233.1 PAS domain-containing protein [Acidobacteriota bacterium]